MSMMSPVVAPPVVGFLLFTVYPVVFAAYASLTSWNGLGPMTFVGLDNYVTAFTTITACLPEAIFD